MNSSSLRAAIKRAFIDYVVSGGKGGGSKEFLFKIKKFLEGSVTWGVRKGPNINYVNNERFPVVKKTKTHTHIQTLQMC